MKFEIAPPYFFPPIMVLMKYVSQVQPILNLEPSEEIDHCVKIKSKIHFYHLSVTFLTVVASESRRT